MTPFSPVRRGTAIALIGLALVAAGCGGSDADDVGSTASTTSTSTTALQDTSVSIEPTIPPTVPAPDGLQATAEAFYRDFFTRDASKTYPGLTAECHATFPNEAAWAAEMDAFFSALGAGRAVAPTFVVGDVLVIGVDGDQAAVIFGATIDGDVFIDLAEAGPSTWRLEEGGWRINDCVLVEGGAGPEEPVAGPPSAP